MDIDKLNPSRFIKSGEFEGRAVTLTMKGVRLEKLESDKGDKIKGIIAFEETEKEWVINKTNTLCVAAILGRETDEWIGKRITLYAAEWNGEPCIRVKGFPHLDADRVIEVKMPKKKPIKMTMFATGKGRKAAAKTEPAAAPDDALPGDEPEAGARG